MIKHLLRVICIFLALSLYSTVQADDINSPESYWYSVEYILFEHRASSVHDQEPWTGAPNSVPEDALTLIPVIQSPEDWTSYRRMRSDEMSLAGAQRVLGKSVSYNILEHSGWIQRIDEDLSSSPIRVQVDAPDQQIVGTLAFRRARFLHLDIDLTLTESPINNAYADTVPAMYRLHQTRRIKTEELHYFDHPRFGVLMKVMPLTPPEPEILLPESVQSTEGNTNESASTNAPTTDQNTQTGNQDNASR